MSNYTHVIPSRTHNYTYQTLIKTLAYTCCAQVFLQAWQQDHGSRAPSATSMADNMLLKSLLQGQGKSARIAIIVYTADSKKLKHGRRMIYAGFALFGLGSEDGPVRTFWLLQVSHDIRRVMSCKPCLSLVYVLIPLAPTHYIPRAFKRLL